MEDKRFDIEIIDDDYEPHSEIDKFVDYMKSKLLKSEIPVANLTFDYKMYDTEFKDIEEDISGWLKSLYSKFKNLNDVEIELVRDDKKNKLYYVKVTLILLSGDEKMSIVKSIAESILKQSSAKYPNDLGFWGLDKNKLDELERHLSKMTVEIKVYDLNKDEFPNLDPEKIFELHLKSDSKNSRKVLEELKRMKAFEIEEHHVTNLKEEKQKSVSK